MENGRCGTASAERKSPKSYRRIGRANRFPENSESCKSVTPRRSGRLFLRCFKSIRAVRFSDAWSQKRPYPVGWAEPRSR